LLSLLSIIASALVAIILHAALPAKVDESLFDGLLVKKVGFPVVAAAYFLVLFTHCSAVLILNRNSLIGSALKSEIKFGLSFSVVYIFGMQEIVLGSTPFTGWGTSFIGYQLLLGLGDAIPVLLLCFFIGKIFFTSPQNDVTTKGKDAAVTIPLFMVLVGTVRLVASYGGVIKSDILDYPIPVTLWGYLIGSVFGMVYLLVESTTLVKTKTMLGGIAVNWMIFNSFIGLIRKGAMYDALLRSMIDLISILMAIGLSTVIKRWRLDFSTIAVDKGRS
jgi:hypothetical protein